MSLKVETLVFWDFIDWLWTWKKYLDFFQALKLQPCYTWNVYLLVQLQSSYVEWVWYNDRQSNYFDQQTTKYYIKQLLDRK